MLPNEIRSEDLIMGDFLHWLHLLFWLLLAFDSDCYSLIQSTYGLTITC